MGIFAFLSFLIDGPKKFTQKPFQHYSTEINIGDYGKSKIGKPRKCKNVQLPATDDPRRPINMQKVWDFFGGSVFSQLESTQINPTKWTMLSIMFAKFSYIGD